MLNLALSFVKFTCILWFQTSASETGIGWGYGCAIRYNISQCQSMKQGHRAEVRKLLLFYFYFFSTWSWKIIPYLLFYFFRPEVGKLLLFYFYFFSTWSWKIIPYLLFYFFSTWSWKIITFLLFYFFSTSSWQIIPYLLFYFFSTSKLARELLRSCTKPSIYFFYFFSTYFFTFSLT